MRQIVAGGGGTRAAAGLPMRQHHSRAPAIAILSDARILGIAGMQLSVRRFSKEQNYESDTTFA